MKSKIAKYSLFFINIAILVFSFLLIAKIKTGTRAIIANYWRSLLPFTLIWIGSGIWGTKYSLHTAPTGGDMFKRVLKCDIVASAFLFGLMYFFRQFHYSRGIVLGTMLGTVLLELFIFVGLYYALRFHHENRDFASTRLVTKSKALEEAQSLKFYLDSGNAVPVISNLSYSPPYLENEAEDSILIPLWKKYLANNQKLFDFINDYLELSHFSKSQSLILDTEGYFNIENEDDASRQLFLNLHTINDLRRFNLYLIRVNQILHDGGVFICHGQTISQRRNQFYKRYTPYLGVLFYGFDFVFRRVLPKLPILQGWYFAITKGRNRAFSETELLGRFYFCGFDLIHKREIDGQMHFILKKSRPHKTDPNPTYGPFIRLKRFGKDGRLIYIKKFRTMHPYSEYLQDYVYSTNALQEGGKFKNDFRVTSWGRVMRALWIDEFPQFLNFFAGELSLVGVRALSEQYFSLYPPDMQELRLKLKPGLLPPFYADMPTSFEEIVESERQYILQKMQKPFCTDWKYFWKGLWNILVKKARSH